MNVSKGSIVALSSAAMLLAWGAASLASAASPASQAIKGDPRKGRIAYMETGCVQCHGTHGQGSRGPTLAGRAIPFAPFAQVVRAPSGNMPPYTKAVLSDAALADIHAYVLSMPGPAPANKIPAKLKP